MSDEVDLLREIRDLLQVIAEPEIAKRDAKRRSSLLSIVGSSRKKAQAVLLMDGTRLKSELSKDAGLDASDVTRLVKGLTEAELLGGNDDKRPKLVLKVPSTFFEEHLDAK